MQQGGVITASLLLITALVVWAIMTLELPTTPYGGRAAFLFPLLILFVELGARWLAHRGLGGNSRVLDARAQAMASAHELSLPQITLPLYLACAVLLGAQIALLAGLFIETILQLTTIGQQSRTIAKSFYRIATNGLIVLAGGGCYELLLWLAGQHIPQPPFEVRLGAAAVGALVMLLLYPLITLPLVGKAPGLSIAGSWVHYFKT